jgi:PAS domain S-box-containing protein
MITADDLNRTLTGVDDVLIPAGLVSRPSRAPDHAAENRALTTLAREMATNPPGVLQACAALVLELCHADSAGISLLKPGAESSLFHWHAVVGPLTGPLGRSIQPEASPSGAVIARDRMLLVREAAQVFPDLKGIHPHGYETLLAPWHSNGEPVGALWAIKHTPEGQFDAEDARLLQSLTHFAAAAHRVTSALEEARTGRVELEQRVEERTRPLSEAYESVRASEMRFRTALEIETVGVIYLDPEGHIIDANDAFLAMGGYSREDLAAGRLTWQGLTPPEWMEASEQAVAELKATGRTTPYEKEYIRKDGSRWWALFAAKRLPDGTIFEFVLDLTARKQAEEALASELKAMTRLHELSRQLVRSANLEEMLAQILDATIELHGADFGNIQLYDKATQTLRIAVQRGFQQPFLDHFAEVDANEGSACGMALARRERVVIADIEQEPAYAPSLETARAAGYRAVQSTPLFTPAGQPLGMLSTHFREPHRWSERDLSLTDVYARLASDAIAAQLLMQSLRESEERFRAVAEQAEAGIVMVNTEGQVIFANDRFGEIIGRARDELVGKTVRELTHPEDWGLNEPRLQRMLTQGEPFTVEKRYVRPNGSPVWVRNAVSPRRDATGRIVGGFAISIDITERKAAEEALQASEERAKLLLGELQHRVRNTLSVIRSIVKRTAQTSTSVEDYAMHLDGRINAFARVQTAVARDPAAGLDLTDLVADELLTYAAHDGEQVRITGPSVRLKPKAAETFGLAVHELATNAVKHGALTVPQGRIRISWRVQNGSDPPRLVFEWKESGTPDRAARRKRRGFGTDLLERTLTYELKAKTVQTFEPDGLRCTIELPMTERIVMGNAASTPEPD